MSAPKSAFMKLQDGIKSFLGDTYANDISMYQHAMAWAIRFCNEMNFDVFKNLKRVFIGVDSDTQTAKLPDDFVQFTKLGLVTANDEFVPLAFNPSLVINPVTPNCDLVSEHCDCGCTDETCYAFGESNVVTTFTDVVINGVTYQNSESVCTQSNGDVVKRTCINTITNPQQTCTYTFTIDYTGLSYPLTNCYFVKNNVNSNVGDIASQAEFIAVFQANGFFVANPILSISNSTDVWDTFHYTENDGTVATAEAVQSACATPTPEVEEICYEEKICEVEVLPCGCIVPTDTAISVINNCCPFFCAVTMRQRKNKDFGQYLAQPKGFFGEFNIDVYEGVVKLNNEYQYDTIFLEYYSANEVDSKEYEIPVQAEEALVAYLYWKSLQRKRNADKWEKQMAAKTYYNEKRLLKQRLNPLRLQELMEVRRTLPVRP